MFEQIHCKKLYYEKETSPVRLFISSLPATLDLSQLQEHDFFYANSSFCLDGQTRVCVCHPLTEYAREHFYYIQSLQTMKATVNNFAENENMDSYLLSYTCTGGGYLEYRGKAYHLRAGEGFLIDCKEPYCYHTEKECWETVDLYFNGPNAAYIFEKFTEGHSVLFRLKNNDLFIDGLEKLAKRNETISPFRELFISNQIENLLLMLPDQSEACGEAPHALPENLTYLVSYIENNYHKPLTLEYLSEFSSISKYHLCRLFRKYLGCSPNEFISRMRIENAQKLLKSTTLPANKIGSMVGIQDENYFYRMFKQRTDQTPTQYRNSD